MKQAQVVLKRARSFFDFELDDRSVKLGRFLFAVVLIIDLLERWSLAEFFFSENGVLTHEAWTNVWGKKPYYWSIHWVSDETMALLFAIQIGLAAAMGLGLFPRLTAFAGWFLLGSLVLRNPLMVYGGDKLSTLLLLAFAFVPTGEEKKSSGKLAQVGGFLFTSQIVITYVAAGAAKIGPNYWMKGEALLNAFHMNLMVKPLGVWLSEFPSLLYLPSVVTPWFELLWPWLLLLPASLWFARVRIIVIAALIGLNAGIFFTLDVGFFMLYTSPALIVLFPREFWNHSLVATVGTWVDARIRATELHIIPRKITRGISYLSVIFLGAVYWVTALEGMKVYDIDWPWPAWNVIRTPNLYQNWGLFTNPNRKLQWYVAKAELNSGEVVDVLQNGSKINYARQRNPNPVFWDNYRWRLAFAKSNKYFKKEPSMRNRLAWAVGKHWDNSHPEEKHVKSVVLYRMTKNLNFEKAEKRFWKIYGEYPLGVAGDGEKRTSTKPTSKASSAGSPTTTKKRVGPSSDVRTQLKRNVLTPTREGAPAKTQSQQPAQTDLDAP